MKPPKGTSVGSNGSRGISIMSVSSIVAQKLRGNKKCDKEKEKRHIFRLLAWL